MIIRNRAQCNKCHEIIESKHVHDFVSCKCGAISVDGGRDYLKRSAKNWDDLIDLSEETEVEIPNKLYSKKFSKVKV